MESGELGKQFISQTKAHTTPPSPSYTIRPSAPWDMLLSRLNFMPEAQTGEEDYKRARYSVLVGKGKFRERNFPGAMPASYYGVYGAPEN